MRLVWLLEFPTLNGGERSLLATLPSVRQEQLEPIVLAPASGPWAAELARQRVEHLAFETRGHDGVKHPREYLRQALAHKLERLRPTLVHANSLSMGRLSGPVVRAAGIPSIAHLRDIVGLSQAAVADLNCHTRLLAVSQATRTFHVGQGVAADRTYVCYNGVDLERFQPRPPTGWLHRQLELPSEVVFAAAIGQIILRKGQDVLIRAAARLKARWPALHWLIIGQRHSHKAETVEYEAQMHRAIHEAALKDRVHFLGTLDDIERVLPELTLLVHAARQEPLGRVLLEAAASGVACVASDVGGTREIFNEPDQARLVVPDDDEELASAVGELLDAPHKRRQMGRAARLRVEQAFDARTSGRALVEHYRAILNA